MVTTTRRVARPVALFILVLFATGPGLVTAGPRIEPPADADAAVAASIARTTDVAVTPIAAPSRPLAAFATNASASTPAKSGGWWSRRTTAQKTWIIVGIVAGAVGIYAIASNGSGGGGGGGY